MPFETGKVTCTAGSPGDSLSGFAIAKKDQRRIFERFAPPNQSRSRNAHFGVEYLRDGAIKYVPFETLESGLRWLNQARD